MRPVFNAISPDLINQIIDEAFQLLLDPGIKVQGEEARALLAEAGAKVNPDSNVVRISEKIVRENLSRVPGEFHLYDQLGSQSVHYGGDSVQFDPGSSGVNVLDPETLQHRPAVSADLVKVIQIAESLPQYDAQSTALVCSEIPKDIGDLYRLYLVLLYANKPVVTGTFRAQNTKWMIEMLAIYAGGEDQLVEKPTAVFDVCPTPPLIWSEFGCQSLIDLARAGVPAEIVSMPLAGVAAPITLLGSVVQHAAECLSGMLIHQLAKAGSPIVWGGAPAIMDMRQGTTPMGAIETAMIDAAYAQVGKSFGFPTHTYLGASDAKVVDYQAGLESGISAMIGALAGINMISGAGMLDFLACVSPEKLVIDAEAIGMAKRMIQGVEAQTNPLAVGMYKGINFQGEFLKQRLTGQLLKKEQYMPSAVIDRGSIRAWQGSGELDSFARARVRVQELIGKYQPPEIDSSRRKELDQLVLRLARDAGLENLPEIQKE